MQMSHLRFGKTRRADNHRQTLCHASVHHRVHRTGKTKIYHNIRFHITLCQALENRPEEELPEILEDATELQELINELAGELEKRSLMFPVWMTVTGLGPILMTVLHVFRGEKDQILIGFVLSLIAVVGMAFTWHNYLTAPKSKRDNSGCLPVLLCGVLTLVGMFGLMIGLQSAQMSLFVPNEQMIMRNPYDKIDLNHTIGGFV